MTLFRLVSYSGEDVANKGIVPTGRWSFETPKLSGSLTKLASALLLFAPPIPAGVTSKLKKLI